MNATLHINPHRIAPLRMRTTIAVVIAVHALALWGVSSELAELPASDESGQVIMADVLTDTPNPAPTLPTKTQTRTPTQPNRTPVSNAPKAEETVPNTTASPQNAATTSANTPATGAAKAGSPSVVEPSADADYLKNPPPAYPRASRRLGEQGTVIVRVLINTQGLPEKAEVRTSSGFIRLDQAALEAVQRWRFVPGRRSGTPEAMWFNIPVRFVLE
ncbi:MAG: hypothetical protein RLZ36_284 [Pseudomonadota bacterium]|jgi:protein TonB